MGGASWGFQRLQRKLLQLELNLLGGIAQFKLESRQNPQSQRQATGLLKQGRHRRAGVFKKLTTLFQREPTQLDLMNLPIHAQLVYSQPGVTGDDQFPQGTGQLPPFGQVHRIGDIIQDEQDFASAGQVAEFFFNDADGLSDQVETVGHLAQAFRIVDLFKIDPENLRKVWLELGPILVDQAEGQGALAGAAGTGQPENPGLFIGQQQAQDFRFLSAFEVVGRENATWETCSARSMFS